MIYISMGHFSGGELFLSTSKEHKINILQVQVLEQAEISSDILILVRNDGGQRLQAL